MSRIEAHTGNDNPATTIAYVVCDNETSKRWSGPFSKVETADEIVRNLGPIYPGRKFGVNTVSVQRT